MTQNSIKALGRAGCKRSSGRLHVWKFFLLGFVSSTAHADSTVIWEPITAEQRAARPPESAPDLVAEVLLSRIDLVVKDYKAVQRNFQRVKIYSDRAVEEMGKLGLEYSESEKVSNLAVRIVHRDGREVAFSGAQFQETVLGRWNHGRRMAKRLIAPHLAAGDMLDIQWQINEDGRFKGSRFIYCQQTIPVRRCEFSMKNQHSGPMNVAAFGALEATIEGAGTARGKVVMKNLPAYVEEVDMPPPFNVRASVLLVYGELPDFDGQIWNQAVTFLQLYEKIQCAVTPDLQRTAAELIRGVTLQGDQLRKLYDFCQTNITNNAYDESPESKNERVVYHEPRTAQETWKAKRGSPLEITCLLCALGKAAGISTQISFSADRDEVMDVNFSHGWFFMKTPGVLAQIGGEWRLFTPGDRVVPFGSRRWQREETQSLVLDGDVIRWVVTETTYNEQAKRTRTGKIGVDENGSLSGSITETLTGQLAIAWRELHWENSPEVLGEAVRSEIRALLPEAEVTEVRVEHAGETDQPLVFHYTLRLANFAQTAGDNMILMPDFFQLHAQPRYGEITRVNAIRWKFAQKEEDDLELQLPGGFAMEAADPQAPISDPAGILYQHVFMEFDPLTSSLRYHREQSVGRLGALNFEKTSFPLLQRIFNDFHRSSTQSMVFRKKSAAESSAAPP